MSSKKMSWQTKWKCICECGNEKDVAESSLVRGLSKSCGCLNDELKRNRFKDLSGQKIGRWTVLLKCSNQMQKKTGNILWLCRCECGTERIVASNNLSNGKTKSCGCYADEIKRLRIKHGLTRRGFKKTLEYNSWASMIQRCTKPTNHKWKDYGGRGITVCTRWRNSFIKFLEDMGRRPTPMHSIDRINNNGNYEPNNCRWATPKEQRTNQRKIIRS